MTLDGIVIHCHAWTPWTPMKQWTPLVSLHGQNVGFKYNINKVMYIVFFLMRGEHNP